VIVDIDGMSKVGTGWNNFKPIDNRIGHTKFSLSDLISHKATPFKQRAQKFSPLSPILKKKKTPPYR